MKLILVRHGDTAISAEEFVQSVDNQLSEKGRLQAKDTAARLVNYPVDLIVSSTYPRAVDTANIINETLQKKIIFNKNLGEVKWPTVLENIKTEDQKVVEYIKLRNDKNVSDINWHYSDEENFVDLKNRSTMLLQELKDLGVENVLGVTHSTFMKVLFTVMCHGPNVNWATYMDFLRFTKPKHTSISTFYTDEKNKWHLDSWNL